MDERKWVQSLAKKLEAEGLGGRRVKVCDGRRLAYTCEVYQYRKDDTCEPSRLLYETDLLISDVETDGCWTPRVVVECKIGGSVTTHDALTYSSKAATHKHVHPYLRYGFLVGEREHYAIPVRLIRHGAYFDFMATWKALNPSKAEWSQFCELIESEIEASRKLQELLLTNRSTRRKKYRVLRRPLVLD